MKTKAIMKNSLNSLNNLKNIKTIPKVIQTMEELDRALLETPLKNVQAFNHTYLIITRNVYKKINEGHFIYPEVMKKLDVNFAHYYFIALKNYLENKNIPPAWKVLFDYGQKNDNFQFVYLTLGVNAHINNDLAFSLHDSINIDYFILDHLKVEKIIKNSIYEVMTSLNETSKTLNFLQNHFIPFYSGLLMLFIKSWRNKAWENHHKLKTKNIQPKVIESKAQNLAQRIIKLSTFI